MELPKLTLADLARSGHVTRWHSVRTFRDQTLAEHHYMVARISFTLAKKILGPDIDDSGLLKILDYALLHDTPELLTGDLPSPLKRHIDQVCAGDNPLDQIEDAIAPWLHKMKLYMQQKHPEYLKVVKLADIIDALIFISSEGVGEHAKGVVAILRNQFASKQKEAAQMFPQYDWSFAQQLCSELLDTREASKLAFEINNN